MMSHYNYYWKSRRRKLDPTRNGKTLSLLSYFLLAIALNNGCPSLVIAAESSATSPGSSDVLQQAFTYAFPVYEMMRVRWNYTEDPNNPLRSGANEIAHGRALIDHTRRVVTTPNNDTLYSRTILDLSVGPVNIHVPDTAGRYYSLAFYDIFTNNFAYIGRRLNGTRDGDYVVVGPDWSQMLPPNSRVIRAPSNDVLVLTRVLVDGQEDLAAAHKVQDGIRISPILKKASARPKAIVPVAGDPSSFVAVVNQALSLNKVPAYETPLLKTFASAGICGAECSWNALSEAVRDRWKERFPAMLASLKKPLAGESRPVNGWFYNPPHIGNFGTDYDYRAIVALNALLAMEPAEVVYPSAETDSQGNTFTGEHRYRLHLPSGGIPVDAFWSLSMYEVAADGRLFFLDNPIKRYAVGDRSKGLRKNLDGSMDILIQRESPGIDLEPNWLPAPRGQFKMVLRGYQPRIDVLDFRFLIPGVEKIDGH
jgi:hypothetical protein